MLVAYADRVDDRVVAHGVLDGLVDAQLAARVVAVREEDDGAARPLRRLRENLLNGDGDGVPDAGAAAELRLQRLVVVVVLTFGACRRVLDLQRADCREEPRGVACGRLVEARDACEGEDGGATPLPHRRL